MTPTIPYIQSCFDEFNTRFFASSLPPIQIKLSNARTFLGKVTFTRRRSWLFGPLRNENFVLRINTRIDLPEDLIQDTILHEMIHYYIAVNQLRDTSSHGRLFRREMARINADGNRHITISYRLSKEQLIELYPEKKNKLRHISCVNQKKVVPLRSIINPLYIYPLNIISLWNIKSKQSEYSPQVAMPRV